MKEQNNNSRMLIMLEILSLAVIFFVLCFILGLERIVEFTGVYLIYDIVPLSVMTLSILTIDGILIFIVSKKAFIKNIYVKTAIICLVLMTSMTIGYCFIYMYGYSGMR